MSAQEKLFQAAIDDNLELARSVIADADLNGRNEEGESPLHIAAKCGSEKVAQLLLSKGADIDALDYLLRTPLHWAVLSKKISMVELLESFNPRKDARDFEDNDAFMLAKNLSDDKIAHVLSQGGSPNPYADRLVLHDKILALTDGEDVISKVLEQRPKLLATVDSKSHVKVNALFKKLVQPEALLCFDCLDNSLKGKNTKFSELSEDMKIMLTEIDLRGKSKSLDKMQRKFYEKLFEKLNTLILEIQEIKKLCTESPDIQTALEQLDSVYANYRDEFCRTKGLLREQMCQSRIRISGGFLAHCYYINPAMSQLFESLFIDEDVLESETSSRIGVVSTSNRIVLKIAETYFKKESKRSKEQCAEIEQVVDSCNNTLAGQGSAPTEFIDILKDDKRLKIPASKGIQGESADDIFQPHPELITNLDPFNHSANAVLAIVQMPDDGKMGNFMAAITKILGNIIIRLTGIDNDRAYRDPVQITKEGNHLVELKSVFFASPQMDMPIDSLFCHEFVKQSPAIFTLVWLSDLLQKKVPQKLNKEIVLGTYQRIKHIHDVLKRNPKITLDALLSEIHPLIGPYYARIRKTRSDIGDAMGAVYSFKRPKLEEFYKDDPVKLKLLDQYNKLDKDFLVPQADLLTDSCVHFINQFDYNDCSDIHIQGFVLNRIISDFQFIENLCIRNCDALNDERLGMLASRLPKLETLTLVNCTRFNGSGLSSLLLSKRGVHIILEGFSQLSSVNLYHLIHHAKNLTLVVLGKSYVIKRNGEMLGHAAELLEVALQGDNVHLTTALLMCGVQFMSDKKAFSSLHFACERGNFVLVQELLRFAVPVDGLNSDGKSALDVTFDMLMKAANTSNELRYQKILLYLLEKGALQCKNPAAIIAKVRIMALSPEKIKSMPTSLRQALFVFACCHGELTPDLVPLLLPENITTLDLNTPKHLNLRMLTLNPAIIEAIRLRCPALTQLNITRCRGVTMAVLQELWLMKKLTSIDMDFEQLLSCGLTKLDEIGQAANVVKMNRRINIISLNLNESLILSGISVNKILGDKLSPVDKVLLTNLAKFIKESKHLLYLEMYKCGLSEQEITQLVEAFKENTSLLSLNANNNPLKGKGTALLVGSVIKHPKLQSLSLEYHDRETAEKNSCGIEGAEAVSNLLSQSNSIESLSLCGNLIGGKGVQVIAKSILARRKASNVKRKSLRLRSLNVNQIGMDATGALLLAHSLMFHPLNYMDIGYNEIGNDGARALMRLLQSNGDLNNLRADSIGTNDKNVREELDKLITRNTLLCRDAALADEISRTLALEQQHVPNLLPPEYSELQAKTAQLEALRAQLRSSPSILSLSGKGSSVGVTSRSPIPEYRSLSALPVLAASKADTKDNKQQMKEEMQTLKAAGYIFGVTLEIKSLTIEINQAPLKKLPLKVISFWQCLMQAVNLSEEPEFTNLKLRFSGLEKSELEKLKIILEEIGLVLPTVWDPKLFVAAKPVQLIAPSSPISTAAISGPARPSLIGERRATIVSPVNVPFEQQRAGTVGSTQSVPLEPSHTATPKAP